jgi:hypothetical protein
MSGIGQDIQCNKCKTVIPASVDECPNCNTRVPLDYATGLPITSLSTNEQFQRQQNGFALVGWVVAIVGLAVCIYFLGFFDPTVTIPGTVNLGGNTPEMKVNNIGLAADRQNGVVCGVGAIVVGGLIIMSNRQR